MLDNDLSDYEGQFLLAQSLWRAMGGTTTDGCGLTVEGYLAVYGTDDADLDLAVFDWANGQFDSPPKADDDCLDQVELKRLFLFWFGDGDEDLVGYLDERILPNYQGLMDATGYELHDLANEMEMDDEDESDYETDDESDYESDDESDDEMAGRSLRARPAPKKVAGRAHLTNKARQ